MENKKLWAGRFDGMSSKQADSFNSSLLFDKRLYREDIEGSIAHCTMLSRVGILSAEDSKLIVKSLKEILKDVDQEKLDPAEGEDIHMWVETELTRRVGAVGKKLHTARSRNDQIALDLRLFLRLQCDKLKSKAANLAQKMMAVAETNLETYMPGFTHLQHAQPVTLAHHMLAYVSMLLRDIDRLTDCSRRLNVLPLGSCALATTTFPIDRDLVASLLSFDSVSQNSLDAVSDRDFCVEYLSALSLIMVHLSRLSEELILWSTVEFRFVELSDEYSTGSSIMPQKKNPDMCELVRGKSGRVFGDLLGMLTVLKGLPLAYNKDMQEDKEAVFDATDTVSACLDIMAPVLSTAKFNTERMRESSIQGFAAATDIADYLVRKGMSFREAHAVVGGIVRHCINQNVSLEQLTLDEFCSFCTLFDASILEDISLSHIVSRRDRIGGPAPSAVLKAIEAAKAALTALVGEPGGAAK